MTIKPIKTERDYQEALKEIEKLWDAKPDTAKGDRFDVLVTLVEAYEQKHYNAHAKIGVLVSSANAPSRCIKFRRSVSSSAIRLFSMPRTMTWCGVPGLSSLACLDIRFSDTLSHRRSSSKIPPE